MVLSICYLTAWHTGSAGHCLDSWFGSLVGGLRLVPGNAIKMEHMEISVSHCKSFPPSWTNPMSWRSICSGMCFSCMCMTKATAQGFSWRLHPFTLITILLWPAAQRLVFVMFNFCCCCCVPLLCGGGSAFNATYQKGLVCFSFCPA